MLYLKWATQKYLKKNLLHLNSNHSCLFLCDVFLLVGISSVSSNHQIFGQSLLVIHIFQRLCCVLKLLLCIKINYMQKNWCVEFFALAILLYIVEHIFISYLPYTLEPPAVVLQWLLVLVIKNRLTNLSQFSLKISVNRSTPCPLAKCIDLSCTTAIIKMRSNLNVSSGNP